MRFVLLAALLFAPIRDAEACSCVDRPFAEHAKTAKRVMLARAGKPVKKGDALKQTFTVLATFKGKADKTFLHDRPATPPCASTHREGEVAILFTTGGDLDPCHGNESLDSQISSFVDIVTATGTKTTTADAKAVDAVLADASLTKGDVKILKSFTAGNVTYVRGKNEKQRERFDSLALRGDDGTWTVVYRRMLVAD